MPERYAEIKRLYECRHADPDFMDLLRADPAGTLRRIQVSMNSSEAVGLAEACGRDGWTDNPFLALYREHVDRIYGEVCRRMDVSRYADPALYRYGWYARDRMSTVCRLTRGHRNMRYYPAAIELSAGCSVQCPFCGLDAPVLTGNAAYDEGGAALFAEILATLMELVGEVADTVPCYYATEPLDHPDYERYLADYRRILGEVPQTTTAIADRDPARFRALLTMIGDAALALAAVRVSVRSRAQFYRLMALYSPSELEHVELVLNNPEAMHYYSDSGRMRRRHDRPAMRAKRVRYTIACVAGLLINLAERRVSFVEPELPSDQYPRGMRVYETRTFTDGASFRQAAEALLGRYVRDHIEPDDVLWFDPEVRVTHEGFEYLFTSDGVACRMGLNRVTADCIDALTKGPSTLRRLGEALGLSDYVMSGVRHRLEALFQKGYLRCAPSVGGQESS